MKTEAGIRHVKTIQTHGQFLIHDDVVSVEEPLEIVLRYFQNEQIQHKTLSISMRTPGHEKELIYGYLFNEGVLNKPAEEISQLEYRFDCNAEQSEQQTIVVHLKKGVIPNIESSNRHSFSNSSCGVCGKTSIDLMLDQCIYLLKKGYPKMSIQNIYKLPEKLFNVQASFRKTGGIHCCALFDTNANLLHWAEDVGRHNAMDKLCGKQMLDNGIPLQDHIILLSGRASFELVYKASMIGCPLLVSIGAPSSLAIDTAESFGMTLLGFVKSNSANIYTHPERILEFKSL
ncbi:MAG: formate dehydrogenase accessory sulfurtransferase FdhD [Saprospiraceae bacterium]|nr:formate dehydrogenase accessory sulfurtransferase FdhD [Saprospiraceae bacterium]